MKTLTKYAVYYVLVFAVFAANMFFYVKDHFFYTMNDLPEGQYLYSSMSPDSNHSAEVYRIETPEGRAIRVELRTFDFSNKENIVSSEKNIYWEVNKSVVTVGWENNDVITIDNRTLDLSLGQTYDSRRITTD
ncbi:MAG: hypothetical protein IJ946_01320 [Clostridia bacterium]|nr:hypothetical protein [Clostridia bacterium]